MSDSVVDQDREEHRSATRDGAWSLRPHDLDCHCRECWQDVRD